ncbi:hypothetical protein ACIQVR_04495 [Streptomyces xanthochromogenes]|uniref:hypothetical protein n=1 Tax=Streptomyces xanthochromogenes TaxID=67384 RepID=UPI003804634D
MTELVRSGDAHTPSTVPDDLADPAQALPPGDELGYLAPLFAGQGTWSAFHIGRGRAGAGRPHAARVSHV